MKEEFMQHVPGVPDWWIRWQYENWLLAVIGIIIVLLAAVAKAVIDGMVDDDVEDVPPHKEHFTTLKL